MQLPANGLVLWPSGESDRFARCKVFLQEHLFEADEGGTSPVVVGRPVEAGTPECGEAIGPILELLHGETIGIIGLPETGCPNVVLFPAFRRAMSKGYGITLIGIQGFFIGNVFACLVFPSP